MDQVAQIRRFNRLVSQRIGVLNDRFLGRDRPLGEARLLFEIGADGAEVRELRARLELDSGYLSRLLRSLEAQGLVADARAPGDKRVRRVRLTKAGLAEWRELDRRSNALAQSLLDPLNGADREKLVGAMAEVERLLVAAALVVEPAPADGDEARACLKAYYAELAARFEEGFEPDPDTPEDAAALSPPDGVFLIARRLGRAVGCAGLRTIGPDVGEVKRVWVSQDARRTGVSTRLMEAIEAKARELKHRTLRLDTNRTLTEAHALYRVLGYREIARYNDNPYADHFFEKKL